ncbi:MAG: ABC transporter permease [Spirochaetes bacterium]|nr:ABC transporter permease [Spirochaetota bacterium]MBU1080408.1 ABC transporter permease [Spirochaetota bacterium]
MLDFIAGVFGSSNYWFIVVRSTAPILLVTLGAVITEQAGIKNMALEGSMLWAALVGVLASAATGSAWIGLLAGMAAGVAIALVLGIFALKLDANAVLVGVALNLLSTGGTVFTLFSITGDKGISSSLASKTLPVIRIPFLADVPWLGKVLSGQNFIIYVSIVAVIVVHVILNKMTIGRRIRATGENVDAARAAGIDPNRIKFFTLVVSGMLAGLAGCFLSMGYTSNFTSGISAGRGYVANAAQVVAGGTAVGSIFAALIFGITDAMATFLQNVGLPPELIQALPYAVTIVGFIVVTLIRDKREAARKLRLFSRGAGR